MNDSPAAKPKARLATWIGLFIALFGLLIVRWAVSFFYPTYSQAGTLWKEPLNWLCAIVLLVIIRRGEKLPLSSIHLGSPWVTSSIGWGVVLALICFVAGGIVASLTHFRGGELGVAFAKFPLWLVILIVIRAGFVEELFYRGYAIERLQLLGLNRFWAAAIPLLVFGFAHGTNGWANIVLALSLGVVLTLFYLWRRDLVANMIGHFLVDFISVVLPRLIVHR
ncbi:MAG TPA: type II CAAX endopeptidase family protein [Chthoniobacterales bacterium]|jgi:membrane protease YdiL (CAAX protease family)